MERRTTIILPDELFKSMKVEIAKRDITLKDFVIQAVKCELNKGDVK